MGLMYIGLLFYSVRFAIYAAISNPWWVLPAELVQGKDRERKCAVAKSIDKLSLETFKYACDDFVKSFTLHN